MFEHKCSMCGKVFPAGTAPARKYCEDCINERRRQQKVLKNERYRAKQKKQDADKPSPAEEQRKRDDKYCSKCIYHGLIAGHCFCDYLSIVGTRRGCKSGEGCEKRELTKGAVDEHGYRRCERCGIKYLGTKTTRLCMACRKEVKQMNQRHMMEVKMAKQESETE